MNEHIRRGNEAYKADDHATASMEFYEALADPDPLTQRIARNRLLELFPRQVYASTHSKLYHATHCPAKNIIRPSRLVWFKDWKEAESAEYIPCHMCQPVRPGAKES